MIIEQFPDHITINVRIVPKSAKQEIAGIYNERVKIKIGSAPEGGKANKELIELLSKKIGIAKSSIEIVSGELSQNKTIRIKGITSDYFLSKVPL